MKTQGRQPSHVRTVKRQNGIRATPAGSEMNVRTIGSMRLKNTVGAPSARTSGRPTRAGCA